MQSKYLLTDQEIYRRVRDWPTKKRAYAMRLATSSWIVVLTMLVVLCAHASAQTTDIGRLEYQASCGACHGADAKGAGPLGKELKTHPTDLTVLAKKNNGVFPVSSVRDIIDGRDMIASHGSREMPIWGYRFALPEQYNLKLLDDYIYSPPVSPEAAVQARILTIIDYLNRIQEK